jgi:hypothetical protein
MMLNLSGNAPKIIQFVFIFVIIIITIALSVGIPWLTIGEQF